jgi:hypothetical protein
MDAPELLIPDACTFDVEITSVKLKKCKMADSDQISAELVVRLVVSVKMRYVRFAPCGGGLEYLHHSPCES